MRNYKVVQYAIIGATIISIVLLVIFRPKKEIVIKKDYKIELSSMIERLENELKYVVLEDRTVYIGKDTVPLGMLKDVAPKRLFICFSNSTCSPCLDGAFRVLDAYMERNVQDTCVFFICEGAPLRLYDNFLGRKLLNVGDGLSFTQEQTNYPVFFTLSKFLEIENVHIFNKLDPTRTQKYISDYVNGNLK